MAYRVTNSVWIFFTILLLACSGSTLRAAENPASANTSKASRDEVLKLIPMQQLQKEDQAKVSKVIKDVCIYRRLPQQVIDCEPDLGLFLVRNPEVIVNMWASMGITKMAMDRTGPDTFKVADGEGTKGNLHILHSTDDFHLIYSEGSYDGPMYARTIRGRCLLALRNEYKQDQRGRILITCTLDMFLAIDNLGLELFAKTFQTAIGKAADHNYAETAKFVTKLSATAETNEEGTIRMIKKIKHCEQERLDEFTNLVVHVDDKLAAAMKMYRQQNPATQTAAAPNVGSDNSINMGAMAIPVTPATIAPPSFKRKVN
jgi:hypothetical protein